MLSSFYNPPGLASSFILKGKLILQELCHEELYWDKQVSEDYMKKWEVWKRELYDLEKISLGRCIKPSNFHKIINTSLHNFSDASNMIKKQLQLQEFDEYFWKDSRVVLGYTANDTKVFKAFVAHRVHIIQENSNASNSGRRMSHQRRILQVMLPKAWILKTLLILIDGFRGQDS